MTSHSIVSKLLNYNSDLKQGTCPLCKKVLFIYMDTWTLFRCDCLFVAQENYMSFQIYIENKIYVINQYFKLNKTYIRCERQNEITVEHLVDFNFDNEEKLKEQILTRVLFS